MELHPDPPTRFHVVHEDSSLLRNVQSLCYFPGLKLPGITFSIHQIQRSRKEYVELNLCFPICLRGVDSENNTFHLRDRIINCHQTAEKMKIQGGPDTAGLLNKSVYRPHIIFMYRVRFTINNYYLRAYCVIQTEIYNNYDSVQIMVQRVHVTELGQAHAPRHTEVCLGTPLASSRSGNI